jgi:hypothetical protein
MIPVVINNFNRLCTTRKLVNDLIRLGVTDIRILDNDSTYPALLDWYKNCGADVVYLNRNIGSRALWDTGYVRTFRQNEFIAYTDSDIELDPNTPADILEVLTGLIRELRVPKAGLALRIDDLPDNKFTEELIRHEKQFWVKRLPHNLEVYNSILDTTFAVFRPREGFTYTAVRVAGEYTCRHRPWYADWDNLPEEEQYVLDHSDIKISTYKQKLLETNRHRSL